MGMLDLAHSDGIGKDHVHGAERFGVRKRQKELLKHVAASGGSGQDAARGLQKSSLTETTANIEGSRRWRIISTCSSAARTPAEGRVGPGAAAD